MSTELGLVVAEIEKQVARARSIGRWSMASFVLWPLGLIIDSVPLASVYLFGVMATTATLFITGRLIESNAKVKAARIHLPAPQLPPARILDR